MCSRLVIFKDETGIKILYDQYFKDKYIYKEIAINMKC